MCIRDRYKGIINSFSKLSCEELLDIPINVTGSKCAIKRLVHDLWLAEGGATKEALDSPDDAQYTNHLYNISNHDQCLNHTYSVCMNVYASPFSLVSVQTQVMDMYKYNGQGVYHLNSTRIKRYEQQAISLFRTGVAPYFTRHDSTKEASTNRFHRVCPFCKYMYGRLFILDVFHVLYNCPIVATERLSMWNRKPYVFFAMPTKYRASVHFRTLSFSVFSFI